MQLPSHWKLIEKIPNDHAKHITLYYDTNLTELRYKGKSIFDYVDKFQDIRLGISADHYGDKEAWIRYPKDIKKFEANLREAKSIIKGINVTVSLLNVFDLYDIKDYYWSNFGIKTTFQNIVRGPQFLSVRNLDEKIKQELIEKYKDLDDGAYIKNELLLPKTHELDRMKIIAIVYLNIETLIGKRCGMSLKICSLYFEGKYKPDYVEKLYNGLKRYCTLPI